MDISDLIQKLSDTDETERIFAADDLGDSNLIAAGEALFARLKVEPSRAVREMIVVALGKIDGDDILKHSVELLDSEDPFIRNEMARLLGSKGEAAIPFLLEGQKHSDPDVRKLVLEAAMEIPGEQAIQLVKTGLNDPSSNVVITAVEYVGLRRISPLKNEVEQIASHWRETMLAMACIETLCAIGDAKSFDLLRESFGNMAGLSDVLDRSLAKAAQRKG